MGKKDKANGAFLEASVPFSRRIFGEKRLKEKTGFIYNLLKLLVYFIKFSLEAFPGEGGADSSFSNVWQEHIGSAGGDGGAPGAFLIG